MGTTVSTAITDTATSVATTVLNRSQTSIKNKSSNTVILDATDVEGDVSISGNKISLSSSTYNEARITEALTGANKERLLSSAANEIVSKLSGLNLGQTAVSTTDVNMTVNATVNLTNDSLTKCLSESINNVRLKASKVKGNVNIDNNIIRIDSKVVHRCIASNASGITNERTVENSTVNKLTSTLAGLSGLEILLAALGAALLILGPIVAPIIAPLVGIPKNIMRGIIVAGSGVVMIILSGGFSTLPGMGGGEDNEDKLKNPVSVKLPKNAITNVTLPALVKESSGKLSTRKDRKFTKTVAKVNGVPVLFAEPKYKGPLAPIDVIKTIMVKPYTAPFYATLSEDRKSIRLSSITGDNDKTFTPTLFMNEPAEEGAGLSVSWFVPIEPPTLASIVYHVRLKPMVFVEDNEKKVNFDTELYKYDGSKWENITHTGVYNAQSIVRTLDTYITAVENLQHAEGVGNIDDIEFENLVIDYMPVTAVEKLGGSSYLSYAKYLGMILIGVGVYIIGFGDSGKPPGEAKKHSKKRKRDDDEDESDESDEDDDEEERPSERRRSSLRKRMKSVGERLLNMVKRRK